MNNSRSWKNNRTWKNLTNTPSTSRHSQIFSSYSAKNAAMWYRRWIKQRWPSARRAGRTPHTIRLFINKNCPRKCTFRLSFVIINLRKSKTRHKQNPWTQSRYQWISTAWTDQINQSEKTRKMKEIWQMLPWHKDSTRNSKKIVT